MHRGSSWLVTVLALTGFLAVTASPLSAGWLPLGGPTEPAIELKLDPGRPELLYARAVFSEGPEEAALWRSFEAIGEGLPSHDAYHLVYRHGLDVDATGRCLVLGSTTGTLWASDDGGDSFHTLTSDLPPIAAVTFT